MLIYSLLLSVGSLLNAEGKVKFESFIRDSVAMHSNTNPAFKEMSGEEDEDDDGVVK